MDDVSGVDRLAQMLGGWPDYFGGVEMVHGRSLLARMRREKVLDEIVFGMIVRYAIHRAAYDRISAQIREAAAGSAQKSEGISFPEQERAYHSNRLAQLEKEMLGTPYQRAKAGMPAQTSFFDLLVEGPKEADSAGKIMPFKPMSRPGHG